MGDNGIITIKKEGDMFVFNGERFKLFKEIISKINDPEDHDKIVIIKFLKPNMYDKQKDCIKKYKEKNKESINEYKKNAYKTKYENNPEFREKEKQKARERYFKRKEKMQK